MGLFGSKKKVYVSSAIYNLAGDVEKRTNFLKHTVLSTVLLQGSRPVGEVIPGAYLSGPGIKFRTFGRWARTKGYSKYLRMSAARVVGNAALDVEIIVQQITEAVNDKVVLQSAEIDYGDYTYWAEQWMLDRYPDEFDTDWVADFDEIHRMITLQREGQVDVEKIGVPTIMRDSQYLFCSFIGSNGKLRMWIYRKGSGRAVLDAMFVPTVGKGELLPFIPVRINNKFLSDTHMREMYRHAKEAYKRAFNADFETMVDKIKDNQSLGDIDHAFVNFGVSLNTPEQAGRKYIYKFFQAMALGGATGGDLDHWEAQANLANDSVEKLEEWSRAQAILDDPLRGTDPPEVKAFPVVPLTSVAVISARPDVDYSMTTSWSSITEETGSGLLEPDAKPGTLWLSQDGKVTRVGLKFFNRATIPTLIPSLEINWQETANSWRRITVAGLKHVNKVYGGKTVDTNVEDALSDDEESGFLVPLHEDVFRSMSLKDSTQLATSCAYLTFNCYKVVKKKWYQTGIFAVIVVIVIIVVSYFFPPAGAAAGGVLGTNVAVGAAIGLTGVAAAIAGAALNAIAAMIVVNLVTKVSVAVFGEKFGAIIGAIAAVMTMQVGQSIASGQSMATAFSGMMSAPNILQLTMAAGDGYAGYIQASTAELMAKAEAVMTEYEGAMGEISRRMQEMFGTDGMANFNPLNLVDSLNGGISESRDSFLARTLLTGSDVADMSVGMIGDMVDMTLNLNLPT